MILVIEADDYWRFLDVYAELRGKLTRGFTHAGNRYTICIDGELDDSLLDELKGKPGISNAYIE